ncbi:hypothetical protein MCAG_02110 [Micromonospora sp. ATCC 39149]|uniref:Uncharacterized protein n=1 Tax=Micromonospora carbonacea TaxID=47853 RepID=A0A7D5Y5M8_9ACTN|nr:hypothetical protein [Micromonospora sp. ATCC 39149]EEP71783.1 hypothetical protein MCAG_02110 [Micromonospora sp. ATCC 39149]QLJ98018.1 hypothetical protein HZU44_25290 [Micromonospora carbonacea]
MALRPADEHLVHQAVEGVRVYLDDLADLISNLSDHGPIAVEIAHSDGERSVADSVDDLVGRTDVLEVTIALLEPRRSGLVSPRRPLEVEAGYGVSYRVDPDRVDLRRVADHFMRTLEKTSHPWWKRLLRPIYGRDVELIFERRSSVKEAKARKHHEYKIALVSGFVGAVIGAVGTVVAALAAGK